MAKDLCASFDALVIEVQSIMICYICDRVDECVSTRYKEQVIGAIQL